MSEQYTCTMCKRTFNKGWSDEEALAERTANGFDHTECDLVCDDCFQKVMTWAQETGLHHE